MIQPIGLYLKDISFRPASAARALTAEKNLWPLILIKSLLGIFPYWSIVLIGYQALGWGAFLYRQSYPHYFDPYWWELLVIPVWGLVIAIDFSIPCYFLGKWLGGMATFTQVLAVVMLASVVSLEEANYSGRHLYALDLAGFSRFLAD